MVIEILFLILMVFGWLYLKSKYNILLGLLIIGFIIIGERVISNMVQKQVFSISGDQEMMRIMLFDKAFEQCISSQLNEQDQIQFGHIKSLIFNKDQNVKSLSSCTEEEIFNLFLVVNHDTIFIPHKSDGKELLNLKLVLILLTCLDRELGRDQELKEVAFDLYKKVNNFDENVDKEFREKNVFLWNFCLREYPKPYIKSEIWQLLQSFFNVGTPPAYLAIVEYCSDLPFYKKLPFRIFGLLLAPLYKSYFPYYQVRDDRIQGIKEMHTEYLFSNK